MSHIGEPLSCAETGKQFIGAVVGCSTNYAKDSVGNIFSDEGVDIRERRELLDRTKPYYAYVSCDGKSVTGWKGNALMHITNLSVGRVGFCRDGVYVQATDVHGNQWYGKGAGKGVCIKLRAKK